MLVTPTTAAAPLGAAASASAPRASFGAVLRRQLTPAPPGLPGAQGTVRVALETLDRARERLDAALAAARRGRTFTSQELLALQADAYRYSQGVEVASRVVEQAVQSVKQAVNTQV
jgi:hypothetical protein